MRQSLGSVGSLVLVTALLLPCSALAQTSQTSTSDGGQAGSTSQDAGTTKKSQDAGSTKKPKSDQAAASTAGTRTSGDLTLRPELTTFMGDTGLWTVPVAEVLPNRHWSFSAYRQNFNDNQGFTNVSNFP